MFGGVLPSKICNSKYYNFLNSKLRHGHISASCTKFPGPSSRMHFVNEYIRTHVNYTTSALRFKINVFFLFSEKNYKKQAQVVCQSHSLHIVKIFCNLILRNHWTWT